MVTARSRSVDVLVVGAGPSGLQAACSAQDAGLSSVVVDRRGLAHSFVEYPQTLRFFSPPDEMEIGGVPLPVRGGEKPCREDILPYFRAVARTRRLDLLLWHEVAECSPSSNGFATVLERRPGGTTRTEVVSRCIMIATGTWDVPNRLTCPGAGLPHVQSRFSEPTEYFGQDVLVVGGGNSAVHAALTLAEAGARVTFAMRREPVAFQSHLRPFVVRDLEMAVGERRLSLRTGVIVTRITPSHAVLQPAQYEPDAMVAAVPCGRPVRVPARFVFALIGQRGDAHLATQLGCRFHADGTIVVRNRAGATSVPGVYALGALTDPRIDIIVKGRSQAAAAIRHAARYLTSVTTTGGVAP